MLKSAPNAIHSTQDSRKQQQHADVLINSIRNTASNNKRFGYRSIQMSCESRMYMLKIMRGVEVEKSQPFLSHGFFERREADCECPLYTKSFRVWKLEEAAV